MIIAIDPGVSGCLVALNDRAEIIDWLHMPVIKVGKRNRVNAAAIAGWIINYDDAKHCYLEKVGAMPGQGTASMFSFGHAAGLVEGVVVGAGIPISLVTPQAWKKHSSLIGSDKDAARGLCAQQYPKCREFDLKGKGQALADAVLIGHYGLTL